MLRRKIKEKNNEGKLLRTNVSCGRKNVYLKIITFSIFLLAQIVIHIHGFNRLHQVGKLLFHVTPFFRYENAYLKTLERAKIV